MKFIRSKLQSLSNKGLALMATMHVAMLTPSFAWAQATTAPFQRVNDTTNMVMATLIAISGAAVTISAVWAGGQILFAKKRIEDCANILWGGTIIGGASAIGAYFAA